jgi:hypothetical protein
MTTAIFNVLNPLATKLKPNSLFSVPPKTTLLITGYVMIFSRCPTQLAQSQALYRV